jgi:hypothetical protein
MSKVISDTVGVSLEIGGEEWLLSDGKVELSREAIPNYADINKMAPNVSAGSSFSNPEELLGKEFSLKVNTDIISERDTNAEEDTLLFIGNVANISAIGTNVYECVAYDPSQQALNTAATGSILSQKVDLDFGREIYFNRNLTQGGTTYTREKARTKRFDDGTVGKATEALTEMFKEVDIGEKDIQLTEFGKKINGPNGSFRGAVDSQVRFPHENPTVRQILDEVTEKTNSKWWFDKRGVFHLGLPEPTIHSPQLITDTSAGLTTPPYQSVKVIGSGVASGGEYGNVPLNPEKPVVVAANVGVNGDGEPEADFKFNVEYGEPSPRLNDPTFVYENRKIITVGQAEKTIKKIVEDLKEQYASGKVTVVGFPEVEVFDVIIMPHAKKSKEDVANYNPRQPMGGSIFGVYKVVHKLNSSDGFKTDIHVAGMTGPASVVVPEEKRVRGRTASGELITSDTGILGQVDDESNRFQRDARQRGLQEDN